MPWRPGQQPDLTLEAYYEDVPDHLREHLFGWVQSVLSTSQSITEGLALYMRVPIAPVDYRTHSEALRVLLDYVVDDDDELLNMIEVLLGGFAVSGPFREGLKQQLEQGHSAYRLNDARTGLAMRELPEVTAQVQHVVQAARGSVGQHLAAAYNAAYGRNPDPERAYKRSILAVEAGLRRILSPNDDAATFTKMLGNLRAKPSKWSFAITDERPSVPGGTSEIDGVALVVAMMETLAYGEVQRHDQGGEGARVNSTEQARAAVMIATTLVQWAMFGALTMAPDPGAWR